MNVYILSGARTPQGRFLGSLSSVKATELGAIAIKGACQKAQISPEKIDEVFMGQVIQAGAGQAPARQAALSAGLPTSVPCTTLNKVCGSGLKAIISGAQSIKTGDNQLVLSGGMENMSKAPHLLEGLRQGLKFGAKEMKDSMQYDGLQDAYSQQPMGNCAEECVKKYNLTRSEQDAFAVESFKRAQKSAEEGIFKREIAPVPVKNRKGETLVEADEGPFNVKFDKIPTLSPAFEKGGTITAANASTINDGAAAVLLGSDAYREKGAFKIVSYAGHAQEPTWFTTAPIEAMRKCLNKADLSLEDIALFEINEAFAAVTMATIKELKLDHSKVNVYGGAVALGHPIGASGARIVITLMNAMENKKARYGMASICLGGGEALAMILERETK